MKKINFLLFPLILLFSNSIFAQKKVVGGVDVDIKDYPWQIALTSSTEGSGFCGGSIIENSWVLTAAHCVNGDNPGDIYVRVGDSNSFASGGDSYSVSQIIIHPNYTGNSHDFALIKIIGEFVYSENVQKIEIIDDLEIALGVQNEGEIATITGWGTTSSGGSLASVLQMVTAPIVSNSVACGISFDSNGNHGEYSCASLDSSMICAGDLINGGEDACQGDSGGPLAVRSYDNSRWLLIGVTSWGNGCADANYPGVWSKVSHVLDWIYTYVSVEEEILCEYTQIIVGGGNWESEVSWSISSCSGEILLEGFSPFEACLNLPENLIINMMDSYGDGWNETLMYIGNSYFTMDEGFEETYLIGDCSDQNTSDIFGCTDQLAINFSQESTIDDGTCEFSCNAPWGDILITGSNHTIFLPSSLVVYDSNGNELFQSILGLFFTNSDGELQCAGQSSFFGESTQIAAMGDDITTDELDGFSSGEIFQWVIWNCETSEANFASADYFEGSNQYSTDGLTFVSSITAIPYGPECQNIYMPAGWSFFSTFMIAEEPDMFSILDPIIDDIIIVKDFQGNAFLPDFSFNGIGDFIIGQGYQIKNEMELELQVCGDYAFPENYPLELLEGWNLVGYLRTEQAPVSAVLSNLTSSGNLIIAKDYSGNAYLPEYSFNGIGDFEPGRGYQLKTIQSDVLMYLSNNNSYRLYLDKSINKK